jgi:hypothetical protein
MLTVMEIIIYEVVFVPLYILLICYVFIVGRLLLVYVGGSSVSRDHISVVVKSLHIVTSRPLPLHHSLLYKDK